MNREACKFFCGSFAALAYAHGAYAIATAGGVIDEPVFLGRRWGIGYMWTEAVIYTAISAGLGYLGWGRPSQAAVSPAATAVTAARDVSPAAAPAGDSQPATL